MPSAACSFFTCAVLRAQQRVHDRLGVGAEPAPYDQFLLVYPGGLTAARVAAIRQAPYQPADSGWRVFDSGRIDWTAEPQARRLYEVAGERPALMSVLSLPAGWSVQFENETLAEAAPPEGEPIAVGMVVGFES
ncbi:MAG: immunity protein Imm33 domain-containing protein [Thermoanaerobaculia bacterium]